MIERVNISVPEQLRDRMKEYKGKVNWSKVACAAFEKFLDDNFDKWDTEQLKEAVGGTIWGEGSNKRKS